AKLAIKRFDAGRDGAKINIIGVVTNAVPKAVPFSYKISKWTGTTWTMVTAGSAQVKANASFDVKAKIASTRDALRLKLEVNGGPNDTPSREFQLVAEKTNFVVRYMTKNGGWACVFDQ